MTSPLLPDTPIQPHPSLSPPPAEQSHIITTGSGEACNNNIHLINNTQDNNMQSTEHQTTDLISTCMLYLSPPPTKSVPSISPLPSPVSHTSTIPSPTSLLALDNFTATYPVASAFLPDVTKQSMELRKRNQVDYKV